MIIILFDGIVYFLEVPNDDSPEFQQKADVIDAILQAPNKNARRDAIAEAAKTLGKSIRTIKRMVERVQKDGVATLAVVRQDKGQFRISKQCPSQDCATENK